MSKSSPTFACPICGKPIRNLKLHRGMDANCIKSLRPGDVVRVEGMYEDNPGLVARALVVRVIDVGLVRVRLQRLGSGGWLCAATTDGFVKNTKKICAEQVLAKEDV